MRIYFRGNLYGCNQATAFVEDKGKIIFIGSDKEALKYSGEQIDLNNKYVYPGFNDSHMHLVNYGQSLKNVLLEKHTNSLKALLEELKKYLVKGQWLIGRGWNHDYFTDEQRFPTRKDLDMISEEEPIVITRTCGHILVANSKAIELANITSEAVEGGYFDLDAGLFQENALYFIYDTINQPNI